MFFKYGEERINVNLVKTYKSIDNEGKNFSIELKFSDGSEKILYYFQDKESHDKLLSFLDQNLL